MRGGIETADKGADAENQKRTLHHRDVADQPGEDAENGADLISGAAAIAARQPADRQRAEPQAEDVNADRQGREAFVRREHGADNAAGRENDRVVAACQRLRDGEHQRVAARKPVVGKRERPWSVASIVDFRESRSLSVTTYALDPATASQRAVTSELPSARVPKLQLFAHP